MMDESSCRQRDLFLDTNSYRQRVGDSRLPLDEGQDKMEQTRED